MLRIRLQRYGKKRAPIYRIVVAEKAAKRDGKYVEAIGFYNPKSKLLVFNTERAKYWQSNGAQASETVKFLLSKEPNHDLANGPYVSSAKTREEKEAIKTEVLALSTKNTKAKKKKAEAEAAAKAAEAEKAAQEAEAPAEENSESAEAEAAA